MFDRKKVGVNSLQLTTKRIIIAYLLCLLIIPMLLGSILGHVYGVHFNSYNAKHRIEFENFLKEKGIKVNADFDTSTEEGKRIIKIIKERIAQDTYVSKIDSISKFLVILTVAIQALLAAALLKSSKHLYIIIGIILGEALISLYLRHGFAYLSPRFIDILIQLLVMVLVGNLVLKFNKSQ